MYQLSGMYDFAGVEGRENAIAVRCSRAVLGSLSLGLSYWHRLTDSASSTGGLQVIRL